jgi:hypothetical protein
MTTLKSFTIVAVLLAGGTSLAMGQNGLPTGGQSPVARGANGGGSRQGILQVSLEPLEISVCVRLRGAGRTRTSNQTVIAETRVNQGSPH